MREIRTSGLMSGDGKRSVATQGPSYRARPRLYGLGTDPDSTWVATNIGKGFGAFEDHLGSLGFNTKGGARLGCMFGFNSRDATFSSRFSSRELGISRHSTNMLDFSGRRGGQAPLISRGQMISDSSVAYGAEPKTYWDSNRQVRVLGA